MTRAGVETRPPTFWNVAAAAFTGARDDPLAAYLGTRSQPRGGARSTVTLPDGTIGYTMTPGRPDGCLAPCIATVLQVPVEEVFDAQVDEARASAPATVPDDLIVEASWANLGLWLDDRGLRTVIHDEAPIHLERWIAACAPPVGLIHPSLGSRLRGRAVFAYLQAARDTIARDDAETARIVEEAITAVKFGLHAVVMRHDEVFHDPAIGLDPPPGQRHCPYDLDDVAYGITIEEGK